MNEADATQALAELAQAQHTPAEHTPAQHTPAEQAQAEHAPSTEPQLAMVAITSDGDTIDVQMGMSTGELDMKTPHGYMLNWLAQNWTALTAAAQISFTKYRQQQSGETTATNIHIATPKLVDAAGIPLQQAIKGA